MNIPPLLIGTASGVFRLGDKTARELPNRVVSALALREGTAWAILDGRELWRQERGGGWEIVAEAQGRKATCLLAAGAGVLVGTDEAHLLRLRGKTLEPVESLDQIEGREEWFTPWGGPPATRSLTEGPTGTLFANIHVGGVARSTDSGKSWRPTMDIGADVHQVSAHPEDASIVLAAAAIGLGVSIDGGEHWTFRRAGLHATYQRAVAVSGSRVLVSSSQGERGRQAAVYRMDLGKRPHFEKCEEGLPTWFSDNVDTHCLAAHGDAAVIGDANGSLYLSQDRGETWALLDKDLPRIRRVAFA